MKIRYDQLSTHLLQPICPVYLIAGEDIIVLKTAENLIRQAAKKVGFNTGFSWIIDVQFDWSLFQKATQQHSLLSEKQYFILYVTTQRFNGLGEKIILNYLKKTRTDQLLIIQMNKLDAVIQKQQWYKIVEKQGIVVPIWPLSLVQIHQWLHQKIQSVGLKTNHDVIQLLATHTKGNLAVAAQVIEKLGLLYADTYLTAQDIAQFNYEEVPTTIFDLIEVIRDNKPMAIVNTLNSLNQALVEPILILWVLIREIRQWLQWLEKIQNGYSLKQLLAGNFRIEKQYLAIAQTLKQHTIPGLYHCLQQAAYIDQIIKGTAPGTVWDNLRQLALTLGCVPHLNMPITI